jgi:adenosylcobinamide kinase/adenosylcobinamide-phosphate guanylyltransferase
MTAEITLITGGARSGKTALAEHLAASRGSTVTYVATYREVGNDAEMAVRIATHRARRPASWGFVAAADTLAPVIAGIGEGSVIVDCLTLYATNALLDAGEAADVDNVAAHLAGDLTAAVATARQKGLDLIMVTNEVGWGIVPQTALGRRFRDLSGRVNAACAVLCDNVVLTVAGIPLLVKGRISL